MKRAGWEREAGISGCRTEGNNQEGLAEKLGSRRLVGTCGAGQSSLGTSIPPAGGRQSKGPEAGALLVCLRRFNVSFRACLHRSLLGTSMRHSLREVTRRLTSPCLFPPPTRPGLPSLKGHSASPRILPFMVLSTFYVAAGSAGSRITWSRLRALGPPWLRSSLCHLPYDLQKTVKDFYEG